jgi:hypothetical protein
MMDSPLRKAWLQDVSIRDDDGYPSSEEEGYASPSGGNNAAQVEMIELIQLNGDDGPEQDAVPDGPASSASSVVNLTNTILGAGMLGMSNAIQNSG